MLSSDQRHTLTKRQLLAVCGSCVGGGALGGYAYRSGFLIDDDCNPPPLDTSPTDWPLPHYDGGNTRTVPPENAPTSGLSERWSISVQNPAQPIVLNGSVFVTPEDPSTEIITAYDVATGEEEWREHVSASVDRLPLLAGGNSLFLGQEQQNGDTVSKALATADGSELWTSDVASEQVLAVLEAGLLLFQDSNKLLAVDARVGEKCWQKRVSGGFMPSTIHAGETIVMNTFTTGEIIALNARTGEQQWEADISEYFHSDAENLNDSIVGRAVAGTDRVFFRTGGGMLIALDATTGETDWVTPKTHPEVPTEGERHYLPPGFEPVAVADDALVVIEWDGSDRSDSLHAIDPTSGAEQWEFEPEEEEDVHIHSAAVAGETVFVPVMEEFYLIDLASGEILETHDLSGYAQSVSLCYGLCLVATTEGIVAFEETS